jgi:hypothetical protein
MESDIHIWGSKQVKWGPLGDGGNKWLYKALCGDLVDGVNIAFLARIQPTCMGCVLVKFQQMAEDAA